MPYKFCRRLEDTLTTSELTTSELDPAVHRLCLSLSGELDIGTVPDAFTAVIEAQPCPGNVVILDMSAISFIDSAGLVMLLNVREYLHGMGCQLTIANPTALLTSLLAIVNLTEHFPIETD
jgi:anti-anti-sigma factor